jgi:hypothetical protein
MKRPGQVARITAADVGFVYSLVLYLTGVRIDAPCSARARLLARAGRRSCSSCGTVGLALAAGLRASSRSCLDGPWTVTLNPTAESHIPEGDNRGPIPAYLVVKQTYWTIVAPNVTVERSSVSRAFFWNLWGSNIGLRGGPAGLDAWLGS